MIASQQHRFAEAIRKLFGGKGTYGLTVIDDVMPTIDVVSQLPDALLERGERRFFNALTQAAVAAQFSSLLYTNPAGSGKLIRLLSLRYVIPTPGGWTAGLSVQVGNQPSGGVALDLRAQAAVSTLQILGGNSAGSVGFITHLKNTTAVQVTGPPIPLDVVLAPGGFSYFLQTDTVNAFLNVGLEWTEREASPEELQVT